MKYANCRKRPLWSGIFLTTMGILGLGIYTDTFRSSEWLAPFLIIVAPMLIAGLLLLGVFVLERKTV